MTTTLTILSGLTALFFIIKSRMKNNYQKKREAFINNLHKGQTISVYRDNGTVKQYIILHIITHKKRVLACDVDNKHHLTHVGFDVIITD